MSRQSCGQVRDSPTCLGLPANQRQRQIQPCWRFPPRAPATRACTAPLHRPGTSHSRDRAFAGRGLASLPCAHLRSPDVRAPPNASLLRPVGRFRIERLRRPLLIRRGCIVYARSAARYVCSAPAGATSRETGSTGPRTWRGGHRRPPAATARTGRTRRTSPCHCRRGAMRPAGRLVRQLFARATRVARWHWAWGHLARVVDPAGGPCSRCAGWIRDRRAAS